MKITGFLTLPIILLLTASVPAQTISVRRAISEAQLVKLIPVLRSIALEVKQSQSAPDTSVSFSHAVSTRLALLQNIKEKKIDPLEWLTANSEQALFPPIAKYSAPVSRLATELTMRPTAVFGFGLEASEFGLAKISGDRETLRKLIERGLNFSDDQEKVNAVMEGLRRFYSERKIFGFQPESIFSWSAQSPDSMIVFTISEVNTYQAWENEDLASGPILELSWNESPENAVSEPNTLAESLPALLEKTGMSDQEFLDLVTALTIARKDIRDPVRLKVNSDAKPQSEEDKKLLEEIQQIVRVRTENVRLYKRYARTLDPLLDAFDDSRK